MTAYHASSSVFMTSKTPSGTKRHHEGFQPESHRTVFLSSCSSDKLVQNHVTLYDSFDMKQQHFTLNSAPAHHFFTTSKSHEALA